MKSKCVHIPSFVCQICVGLYRILCRVYKATDSRSMISFIETMADLSDRDTDVEELIDGAEESSENVNGHRTVNNEKYKRIQLLIRKSPFIL